MQKNISIQDDENQPAQFHKKCFTKFFRIMKNSNRYLKVSELKNGYCYKIIARNAYVGIWVERRKSFLISRYKHNPPPFLFEEYHWDIGKPFGTVKPLEEIEKSPFNITKKRYDMINCEVIITYLDQQEEQNPIVPGFNSLQDRKRTATGWIDRQRRQREIAQESTIL